MSEITVCVPVFNAGAFVGHTLESIAAQSFADIKVLISLDRSDDDSEAVCRRYLADSRFELVVQPERLGWVRNANALIARVDTPFFCITPHDDLLAPRYLAEVHALATSDLSVACAYTDMECFGVTGHGVILQPDIRGSTVDRITEFLLDHFNAVAFRGLVRRHDAEDRPYLPTGLQGDFAADTVWMFDLALRGELRRVPRPLYAKRYYAGSVHAGWGAWPREELVRLWAVHTAVCVRKALDRTEDIHDAERVLSAAFIRAAGMGKAAENVAAPRGPREVADATTAFCEALGQAPSSRLDAVLALPDGRYLRNIIARHASRRSLASPT